MGPALPGSYSGNQAWCFLNNTVILSLSPLWLACEKAPHIPGWQILCLWSRGHHLLTQGIHVGSEPLWVQQGHLFILFWNLNLCIWHILNQLRRELPSCVIFLPLAEFSFSLMINNKNTNPTPPSWVPAVHSGFMESCCVLAEGIRIPRGICSLCERAKV
jgi:hypothetical protein